MLWQRHYPILRFLLLTSNLILPPVCFFLYLFDRSWSSLILCLAVTAVCHAALLFAIFHPRCPWLGPVVRRFRTERKALWLTIDDGPDGPQSVALAEALQARGVRATFFVVGERVRRQPEAPRAILAAGHTVANHTLTHPRGTMWCLPWRQARAEVAGGAEALREFGVETKWFRAAVGHKSPTLHPALRRHGQRLIAWSIGGRDGYAPDPENVLRRVVAGARPGAILLLHEHREHTQSTILPIVDALMAEGYEFRVPEDGELE